MKPFAVLTLVILAALAPFAAALAEDAPEQPITMSPVTTAFTYQGKLDRNSIPGNFMCNFQFSLYDALGGGLLIAGPLAVNGVTVTNGLFTVSLDFGGAAFAGQARWLEIACQCTGDGSFTTLAPRQPLTAVPYAMHALAGAASLSLPFSGSTSTTQDAFLVTNTSVSSALSAVHGRLSSTATGGTGAVFGEATGASGGTVGVYGIATASPQGTGAVGKGGATGGFFEATSSGGTGAYGIGNGSGTGVQGTSGSGTGVQGESSSGWGMFARSQSSTGILGQSLGNSAGVAGRCEGTTGQGVFGYAPNGALGVWGVGEVGNGVQGQTNGGANACGVFGSATNSAAFGGFFANYAPGGVALRADGRAQVKVLEILGADLVEKFDSKGAPSGECEPGTVVVIDDQSPGKIRASRDRYDRKVAGVVSGAGGIPHGIHLGQGGALDGDTPVAMTGRVYVKCTTENGAIRPGDRLTTSSATGHAMRATDATLSDGSVIGKAMSSLDEETGLVLVLVNLQ